MKRLRSIRAFARKGILNAFFFRNHILDRLDNFKQLRRAANRFEEILAEEF